LTAGANRLDISGAEYPVAQMAGQGHASRMMMCRVEAPEAKVSVLNHGCKPRQHLKPYHRLIGGCAGQNLTIFLTKT
jgi:hypothetical protein